MLIPRHFLYVLPSVLWQLLVTCAFSRGINLESVIGILYSIIMTRSVHFTVSFCRLLVSSSNTFPRLFLFGLLNSSGGRSTLNGETSYKITGSLKLPLSE